MIPLQEIPSRAALSREGYSLVESDRPEEILDGAFFLSGEVPRRSFERGMPNHLRLTPSGDWEPDPLVTDERFMVADVRGKGLAIFTGCSHAGVVNVCPHAQDLFPGTRLYALVGGLHLVYPNEDLIDETIAELKKFNVRLHHSRTLHRVRAVHGSPAHFGRDCRSFSSWDATVPLGANALFVH